MNSNVLKTINYIKRNGVGDTFWAVKERLGERKSLGYVYSLPQKGELIKQKEFSKGKNLKISVLVPAYETASVFMRELIDSLISQTYGNWELVIADASKTEIVSEAVKKYEDNRIRYVRLNENTGISGNSNEGLKHCTGDYIALLDHDDILAPNALYEMASAVKFDPKSPIKIVYSDEDKTDGDNNIYFDPNIKPDFNLSLLLSNNYICHFLMLEAKMLKSLGFRSEYDGAQDHDLILRAVSYLKGEYESLYREHISHVGLVLYHWRCHEASTASNPQSKEYAYDAGKRAVEDFLKTEGIEARVLKSKHLGFLDVDYENDIFTQRPEIGAVGGRVVSALGTVKAGAMDENRKVLFKGTDYHESGGYLHRASCKMEVPYLDVRSISMSPYVAGLYDEYVKKAGTPDKNTDYVAFSCKFCDIIKDNGYLLMYDPHMIYRG